MGMRENFNMKKVLVLLSAYNGEKYLQEQLDSLLGQEGVEVHILIRDDGSTDSTISLVERYIQEHPNEIELIKGENIGCKESFFALIKKAVQKGNESYDYYAFCDQDDEWLPEKLHRAVEMLDNKQDQYKLYFCTANLVDQDLNFICSTLPPKVFNYKTSIYSNPALGCTMVFNRELLEMCNRAPIEGCNLHDAWMFKCANFLDAAIISDDRPLINYRQHGDNVTTYHKGRVKRYMLALKRLKSKKGFNLVFVNRHFYDTYKGYLNEEKKEFLQTLINYKRSPAATIKYLRMQNFEAASPIDRFIWRLFILLHLGN
jgi:glycosyltransferase involved in cell wall biosynthesis